MNSSEILSTYRAYLCDSLSRAESPVIVESAILIDLLRYADKAHISRHKLYILRGFEYLDNEVQGNLLRLIRRSLELSQEMVSKSTGLSQGDISVLENGNNKKIKGKTFKIGKKKLGKLLSFYREFPCGSEAA